MLPSFYHPDRVLTLGILGGGQLAKMLAQAAYRLGLRVAVIENAPESPAGVMTPHDFGGGWNDPQELQRFLDVCDYVTLENEFIDPAILDRIAERRPVYPSADTLRLVRDKLTQKETMRAAGIPTTEFESINSLDEAYAYGDNRAYPWIMKTREFGYDGYGNFTVERRNHALLAWSRFSSGEAPRAVMAESFVSFSKELAVMVARNQRGELAVYPCVETVQKNHICHTVTAPADIPAALARQAADVAVAAVEAIAGVGVFGVEMFLADGDRILFNEIAPRPHNSGHYTIEASHCSQFENCIRAVLNLPLGNPELVCGGAAMVNILGSRGGPGVPDSPVEFFRHADASLHLYGKKDSRKGRKMGHATALGSNAADALAKITAAVDDLIW